MTPYIHYHVSLLLISAGADTLGYIHTTGLPLTLHLPTTPSGFTDTGVGLFLEVIPKQDTSRTLMVSEVTEEHIYISQPKEVHPSIKFPITRP